MKRVVMAMSLLWACGDVQEKPSNGSYSSPSTEPSSQPEDADTAVDSEEEDFCDYVFLLERRASGGSFVPYLWRFDPVTTNLVELGILDCPFSGFGDYLIAMTADQKGRLWFLSNEEYLFISDPSTLECSATNIEAFDLENGIRSRSLAFMRTGEEAPDQLFFSSYFSLSANRQGILTSLVQNELAVVGEIPGFVGNGAVMELAGSADGRIFGQSFAVGESSHFIELDHYTGDVLSDVELGIESGNAFTFAIIDGYAWMFLATGAGGVSEVFRYEPDLNELEYIKTLNTTMLGSAAPTCSSGSNGS